MDRRRAKERAASPPPHHRPSEAPDKQARNREDAATATPNPYLDGDLLAVLVDKHFGGVA